MIVTPIADFVSQLAADVAIGDTTATLAFATDADGNALPSGLYCFTNDRTQSNKEYTIATLIGTALTNIFSVSRQGVQTTGFTQKHRRGAEVIISDWVMIKSIISILNGTSPLDSTSPLGYDGAPSSLTGNQLATVAYVLSVVSGGTVTFDQQVIGNQLAGETLTVNQVVYFKESDQRWYKAGAQIISATQQIQLGITKTAASAGGGITVAISGPVSGFSGLTLGSKYYVSNTAGSISTTPGSTSIFVGWALSTTRLLFVPSEKDIPTGTLSATVNPDNFVIEDNVSASSFDQTQLVSNATIETGQVNSTGQKNKIAQSFIPTRTKIRGVSIKKQADTGTFTGTVTVSIQADTSGSPSGTDLASLVLTNTQWASIAAGSAADVIFSLEYDSLITGASYWIVLTPSTADNSNHPNLSYQNTNVYANGVLKYNNTTDGWVSVTGDLYFRTLEGNAYQIPKTDINGELTGFTKAPIINIFTAQNYLGSVTTQFTITNPSGTTFRYTYNGVGTDPGISNLTIYIGQAISIQSSAMNAANIGVFAVTGVGSNYFEVTNASGVSESNKALTSGYLDIGTSYVKPSNLKYITVEVQGAGYAGKAGTGSGTGSPDGGFGGGAGAYAKKTITTGNLSFRTQVIVGLTVPNTSSLAAGSSAFSASIVANGGGATSTMAVGGIAIGGDINSKGQGGNPGNTNGGGAGGNSHMGGGGAGSTSSTADSGGIGAGGGGGGVSSGNQLGGNGGDGIVIITEYY